MTFLQLLLYAGGVHRGGVVALFRSDKISEIHDLEEIFVLAPGLRVSVHVGWLHCGEPLMRQNITSRA